jgi:hypothetical protein
MRFSDFDDWWLERRRSGLGIGPDAEFFRVPTGLTVDSSGGAFRFQGPAQAVAGLRDEFARLARSQPDTEVRIEGWVLRVQDEVPTAVESGVIVLPWHAWQMVGILLSDVAYGYYDSPFDFSEVGYICLITEDGTRLPWPQPDIGVIVDGPLLG